MALESAGIDLQAKNFSEYIKRLEKINEEQQKVFNVTSQKTGRTIEQVAKEYRGFQKEIERTRKAQARAQQESGGLAAAQKTAAATQRQALISTGQVVIDFVKQIASAGFELGKLGAQFQGSQTGLSNLAASFGQSGSDIQKAIQGASRGTLSGLQAIQAANQGLLLGVAQTPEEFANLTKSALTLGRTLGLDATQSIEQFTSALGRRSLLILDNFGISAKQVNAEIERLAQVNFGTTARGLTEAQKQATFMEAALNVAADATTRIGDEAGEAQAAFDRLTASGKDFQTELGIAISNLNKSLGITDALTREIKQATEALQILRGGREDAPLDEQIQATELRIEDLRQTLENTRSELEEGGGLFGTGLFEDFLTGLDESAIESQEKALADLEAQLGQLNLEKAAEDQEKFNDAANNAPPIIEDSTEAIEAYQNALKQAESLQLSFARAAEDAARNQARAAEDATRRLNKQTAKLGRDQFRDRVDLLNDQGKEFDQFQEDELESVQKAEQKLNEAREKAGKERLRDQDKLHRELRQAEERFNLDRFQSQRRFDLQDRRLRAAGDVLALQELREDFSLQQQEAQENFDLQDDQRREDGKSQKDAADEQRQEQIKQLEQEFNDLQSGLDQRRTEFLASQTEEFNDLLFSQAQQRQSLQESYREQQEDRALALQREEEDRRISQRRQLEDLGQSLADQEGVTAEGVNNIADQIERVFGMAGVANNIIVGFSERTRSEFNDLIDNVENSFEKLQGIEERTRTRNVRRGLLDELAERQREAITIPIPAGGVPAFQDGGIVGGPIGAPVPAIVHGGETILPTHQQSFSMNAPVIPSQTLNVNMAGGFNITGGEAAGEAATRQAIVEMTDALEITVKRLGRQI